MCWLVRVVFVLGCNDVYTLPPVVSPTRRDRFRQKILNHDGRKSPPTSIHQAHHQRRIKTGHKRFRISQVICRDRATHDNRSRKNSIRLRIITECHATNIATHQITFVLIIFLTRTNRPYAAGREARNQIGTLPAVVCAGLLGLFGFRTKQTQPTMNVNVVGAMAQRPLRIHLRWRNRS
jgi:hypothetical protein